MKEMVNAMWTVVPPMGGKGVHSRIGPFLPVLAMTQGSRLIAAEIPTKSSTAL
jgi:hypothetical protein